jgi:ribosomal protein L14E/L6E/L27E
VSGLNYSIGQLVISTAGRDLGRIYIIIGQAGGTRLVLADGSERRLANPKKKNIRHVRTLGFFAESIAKKTESGLPIRDEEIRQVLNLVQPENL